MGKRDNIAPVWTKALMDRGFVVVSIDYRLVPQVSLLEGPITDARDAYHWCRNDLPTILTKDASLNVDSTQIVALGWSAGGHLAMMLGAEKEKPLAILNCYGPLNFDHLSFSKSVNKIMPLIPAGPLKFDEALMNKVYDEPVLTFTENTIITNPATGKLEIDFSQPRNAWSFGNISRGTWVEAMGIKGQEELVDPARQLSKDFPPTMFLWGEHDEILPAELAEMAYEELKTLGVETEITVAKGFGHAFGAGLVEGTEEHENYVIKPADFLAKHVDL